MPRIFIERDCGEFFLYTETDFGEEADEDSEEVQQWMSQASIDLENLEEVIRNVLSPYDFPLITYDPDLPFYEKEKDQSCRMRSRMIEYSRGFDEPNYLRIYVAFSMPPPIEDLEEVGEKFESAVKRYSADFIV